MPEKKSLGRAKATSEEWFQLATARLEEALDWCVEDWARFETNYAFYAGDHLTPEQKKNLDDAERAYVSWPDIPAIVNSMTGRAVTSSYQPMFRGRIPTKSRPGSPAGELPPDQDDTKGAQALTEVLRTLRGMTDVEVREGEAFLDTFVCGMGWTESYISFLDDPNGQLMRKSCSPWEMLWDGAALERNLTDRWYTFRLRELVLEEAQRRYPNSAKDLEGLKNAEGKWWAAMSDLAEKGLKALGFQGSSRYLNNGRIYDSKTRKIMVIEYEYREVASDISYLVVPPDGQGWQTVDKDGFNQWQAMMQEAGKTPQKNRNYRQQDIYAYRKAAIAGDQLVLEEPETQPIRTWTYEAMTCFPKKMKGGTRWIGPVDLGRDPQRWKDRVTALMLDQLATSPKAPIIAEKSAVDDIEDFQQKITRHDEIVFVEDGALQNNRIVFGRTPSYFQALSPVIELAQTAVWQSMGHSPWAAGMVQDVRRAAFASVNAVQVANQSAFTQPFEALRLHRRRGALLDMALAGHYISADVIQRYVGEEHTAALPNDKIGPEGYYDHALVDRIRFDAVVDESPTSPNQIRDLLQVLTQTNMLEVLSTMGHQPPLNVLVDMFKEVGLPASMAEDWLAGSENQVIQAFVASLPPEIQAAIQAAMEAAAAEQQTEGAAA